MSESFILEVAPASRRPDRTRLASAAPGRRRSGRRDGGATDKFLILGHRGSPYKERENTVASFEAALRAGADGFETDLRLLSDRTAVLYHDDDVGDEACETLSARDLVERGLVVEQLDTVGSFAGRGTIVLEVKRSQW